MIVVWLIVWLIHNTPAVHPGNAWFVTLLVSLVLA